MIVDSFYLKKDGQKLNGLDIFWTGTQVAQKLLTYALGRGVEYYDAPSIRRIVRESADEDYSWAALITGIINSTPFQMRNALQINDPIHQTREIKVKAGN